MGMLIQHRCDQLGPSINGISRIARALLFGSKVRQCVLFDVVTQNCQGAPSHPFPSFSRSSRGFVPNHTARPYLSFVLYQYIDGYKVDYAVIRIKTSFLATVKILGILKFACQHIIFLLLWFGTIVLLSLPCLVWNLIVCRVVSAAGVYCLPSTPPVTLLVLWG